MRTDEKMIRQKWNFKKLFIEYLNVIFFLNISESLIEIRLKFVRS